MLGLPKTETVTVGSESFAKSWTHDQATGFQRTATEHGIATTFEPDAQGNVALVRKANGKETSFTYSFGHVKQTTTPEYVISREINPDGTVSQETRGTRVTSYTYDELSRLKETQPPGGPGLANPIRVDYDNISGRWVKTSRGNSWLETTLDGFGRPTLTTNSLNVQTRTGYDAEGRIIYEGYPFQAPLFPDKGTSIAYDTLGRVTTRTNPDDTSSLRTYGGGSVTIYDENGHPTTQTWKAFGHPDEARLTAVIDADAKSWTYTYHALGQLWTVTAPDGLVRSWQYNTNNQLTSETHPESDTAIYTYDAAGVLATKTDAKGTVFTYSYDGNDRVRSISAAPGGITNITYEPGSDNRQSASTGTTSTTSTYDSAGRLAQRRDAVGAYVFNTSYTYDANDDLKDLTYPSGRVVRYDYDTERQITHVYEVAAGRDYAVGMTYHPSGALATYTAGNTIATTVTYDPQRYWLRGITSGALQLTYDNYDGVGNVRTIGDSRPDTTQTFTYDVLDRVHLAVGAYGSLEYLYNAHGNRVDANGSTYTYQPGTLRLSTQNGTPYGYDSNGNMTSAGGNTYTYTPENWLASATIPGGSVSYGYDGDGWRVKKAVTGDTTVYLRGAGNELLTEWHNLGTTARTRDYIYAGSRLLSAVDRTSGFPTSCGGQSIPDGSPNAVTIPTGGTASVTFEGSACRRVSVKVAVTSGSLGCSYVRIFKPDGTQLSSNGTCSSTSPLFLEPVTLPMSARYTVRVDASATGSGTANVYIYDVVDVVDPITQGGPAVSANLLTPGQTARLPFTGAAGQRISAKAVVTSGDLGCIAYLKILQPDGNPLGSYGTCSSTSTPLFVDPVTLPAAGTYTVLIDPALSSTGNVTVNLYNVVDVTDPITPSGPTVTANLLTPGQAARLPFTGTAGQRISAKAVVTSGDLGCIAYLKILQPTGNPLGSYGTCSSTSTPLFVDPVTLPAAGTYTVLIDPALSSTGNVTVNLYNVVDVTDPITPSGPTVTANLLTPGQAARLPFTGTAGQRISANVVVVSGNLGCAWYRKILKPDGSELASNGSCSTSPLFLEPVTLTVPGTHTVVVDPAGPSTGSVNVNLWDLPPDVTGTLTVGGGAVPVTLTTPGQQATLTFSGTQGQQVTVRVTGNTMGLTLVRLRKPDGSQLTSTSSGNSSFNLFPQTLPTTGTFSVLVDPSTTNVGTLNVAVTSP